VAFVYLLWICIFTTAQMLMTNTIEEKSNRIMEVLRSSVSPLQLMLGKIAGIAFTGLTMVSTWAAFFFLAANYLPSFFGLELDFDLGAIVGNPWLLGSFIAYFLFGYLFYAALLVGIGSVCNSLKEAQNLMQPIMLLLIVPMITMFPVGQDPNGTLAKVLSYIPPFTPFVMMNRAAAPPTMMEYVLTTLLLVVSIGIVTWAASKVFRVGVLMTGKPPKIKEILGWLKAPVGQVPERKT
jgi:ABC-type Na+ efflux pump permease subunit